MTSHSRPGWPWRSPDGRRWAARQTLSADEVYGRDAEGHLAEGGLGGRALSPHSPALKRALLSFTADAGTGWGTKTTRRVFQAGAVLNCVKDPSPEKPGNNKPQNRLWGWWCVFHLEGSPEPDRRFPPNNPKKRACVCPGDSGLDPYSTDVEFFKEILWRVETRCHFRPKILGSS